MLSEEVMWMVRAGQGAAFVDDFIDKNFVGIGFKQAGELETPVDKAAVIATMQRSNPQGRFVMAATQLQKFYDEFKIGDTVRTDLRPGPAALLHWQDHLRCAVY